MRESSDLPNRALGTNRAGCLGSTTRNPKRLQYDWIPHQVRDDNKSESVARQKRDYRATTRVSRKVQAQLGYVHPETTAIQLDPGSSPG
jgi:hypothetical protein